MAKWLKKGNISNKQQATNELQCCQTPIKWGYITKSFLKFHAHKYPSVTRDIEATRPVVQSGHFESDPLETLGQLGCLFNGHAAINAGHEVTAAQRSIGKFDKSHEARR